MRIYKTHHARFIVLAWLAFVLLWPVQGAKALTIGHGAMVACPFMPGMMMHATMQTGKIFHGPLSMMACRHIQCHHQLGMNVYHATAHIPLHRVVNHIAPPQTRILSLQRQLHAQIPRWPPPDSRSTRLLI